MSHYRYRKPEGILIENQFSDHWINDFFSCSSSENESEQKTAKEILQNILGEVVVVRKKINGQTVGCGYGAIERDYIGIFDIIVAKEYRGKGFGRDYGWDIKRCP